MLEIMKIKDNNSSWCPNDKDSKIAFNKDIVNIWGKILNRHWT